MKKYFAAGLIFILIGLAAVAQPAEQTDTTWKKNYRSSAEKIHDLVHTKLEASFDIPGAYMYGKVWLTLKPHYYSSNILVLDAKGMEIKEIAIQKGAVKSKLKYEYDGLLLKITLDKTYKGGEAFTVYIDYVSKPNEFKAQGSAAITGAKGLYFINPKGEEKESPHKYGHKAKQKAQVFGALR